MFLRLLPKYFCLLLVVLTVGCSQIPSDTSKVKSSQEFLVGYYQQLSQRYEAALEAAPDNSGLRLQIAQFYYAFRDYEKAEQVLQESTESSLRALLAKVYTRLKEYDRAIEIFEQLELSAQDDEYKYCYGQVLEKKNLFPKALRVYKDVGGSYRAQAQQRIALITTKIEEGIPPHIAKLSAEAARFVAAAKDEAAVLLLVDEEMQVLPDKTSVSYMHVIEQVLQERGKELAEVEIGYDSTYQRIELELARTITKDGKVIYAGKENVRDVSRYLNFPLYSNSRAYIVSMPSVAVGSIIEYKIKIYSSKLVNGDDFSFIYRLREKYPIFRASFQLVTPPTTPVNFKFFNLGYAEGIDLKPSVSARGKEKIYRWEFNEIQPIIPEYNMSPSADINPAFLVSSFADWQEVYQWWHSLYQDKLALNAETKAFLQKLIAGAAAKETKAKKIYEFVAKNIRYVAIEYGDSGHEPHRAQEVFVNRYGDCKDQAILLVAMLRQAGLSAYPVLIPTREAYPIAEDFASINFNHAIAAVKLEDKLIFMDPTSETTAFRELPLADQARKVMVFFDEGFAIAETPFSQDNHLNFEMDIVLNEEENATVSRSVWAHGFFASGYRYYLKYTHPLVIEEDILQKMTEISSLSKLQDYKIFYADDFDFDPRLSYKFTAEKFLNPARNLRIVPVLDQVGLDHNLIGKEKRNFPIDFSGMSTRSARIKIQLPENLKVKYLPESKTLENEWFRMVISYQQEESLIEFYQEFAVKKRLVSQGEYQAFKDSFKKALYLLREEIILEKKP